MTRSTSTIGVPSPASCFSLTRNRTNPIRGMPTVGVRVDYVRTDSVGNEEV